MLPVSLQNVTEEIALYSAQHPELFAFLLVDPFFNQPVSDALLTEKLPHIQSETIRCPAVWPDKTLCPALYTIDPSMHTHIISYALNYAYSEQQPENRSMHTGYSICGILFGHEPAKETADWLAKSSELLTPHGETRFFNFFDRRVMYHLERILAKEQLAQLYGPIVQWGLMTPYETWKNIVNPFYSNPATRQNGQAGFFQCDKSTWVKLNQIESANLAFTKISEHEFLTARLCQTVLLNIENASMQGIQPSEDQALYAIDAYFEGGDLSQHPRFSSVLNQLQSGIPYTQARQLLNQSISQG